MSTSTIERPTTSTVLTADATLADLIRADRLVNRAGLGTNPATAPLAVLIRPAGLRVA